MWRKQRLGGINKHMNGKKMQKVIKTVMYRKLLGYQVHLKYIFSNIVQIWCFFVLLLLYISEGNIVLHYIYDNYSYLSD